MNLQDMFDNESPKKFVRISDEHRAKLRATRAQQVRPHVSEETRAKIKAAHLANPVFGKPIQTPLGLFPSKKAAVEGMTAAGVVNAGGRLSVWLDKKHPKNRADEYYYITQENKKTSQLIVFIFKLIFLLP
jgi:hypothetical protein